MPMAFLMASAKLAAWIFSINSSVSNSVLAILSFNAPELLNRR
tara:strand:+ start:73 stop:201 length:129 start_codon:yes stop_codon:yes gene_type:complete